jgi:hypothetical protein
MPLNFFLSSEFFDLFLASFYADFAVVRRGVADWVVAGCP